MMAHHYWHEMFNLNLRILLFLPALPYEVKIINAQTFRRVSNALGVAARTPKRQTSLTSERFIEELKSTRNKISPRCHIIYSTCNEIYDY